MESAWATSAYATESGWDLTARMRPVRIAVAKVKDEVAARRASVTAHAGSAAASAI